MRFDADLLATGWLSVAVAAGRDKARPALCQTVHIEEHDHGIRLVATDSYVLLHAWVPALDGRHKEEPDLDEAPSRSATVADPDGRCRGLLGFARKVAAVAAKQEHPAPVIDLGVDIDAPDLTPAGQIPGMGQSYVALDLVDSADSDVLVAERVRIAVYEGAYPSWRTVLDGFSGGPAGTVALSPTILARIGKLGALHEGPVVWEFAGPHRAARVEVHGSAPYVSGFVVPVRVNGSAPEPEPPPDPGIVVTTDGNGVLLLDDEAAALRGEDERVAAGYVSEAVPPEDDGHMIDLGEQAGGADYAGELVYDENGVLGEILDVDEDSTPPELVGPHPLGEDIDMGDDSLEDGIPDEDDLEDPVCSRCGQTIVEGDLGRHVRGECTPYDEDQAEAEIAAGEVLPPEDDETPPPDTEWWVYADGELVERTIAGHRSDYVVAQHEDDHWVCVVEKLAGAPEWLVRDEVAVRWIAQHLPEDALRMTGIEVIAALDKLDPVVPTWALRLLLHHQRYGAHHKWSRDVTTTLAQWIAEDGTAVPTTSGEEVAPAGSAPPAGPPPSTSSPADPSEEGGAPTHPDEARGQVDAPSSHTGTVGSPSSGDPSVHAATIAALWPKGIARYRLDQIDRPLKARLHDGEQDPVGLIAAVRAADMAAHPQGTGRRNVLRELDQLAEAWQDAR